MLGGSDDVLLSLMVEDADGTVSRRDGLSRVEVLAVLERLLSSDFVDGLGEVTVFTEASARALGALPVPGAADRRARVLAAHTLTPGGWECEGCVSSSWNDCPALASVLSPAELRVLLGG